ncbi:hypothetical protein DL764_004539 [Monosporascus ibericus]|uniref:Uncharacterized protein n=1 Tax=Monosporascus ibericus TaxID=155417 RepID=A0A4Q4TC59_9PEZI|nr:hypothetical protein DL764_004539 [Monosporascus ibericus]
MEISDMLWHSDPLRALITEGTQQTSFLATTDSDLPTPDIQGRGNGTAPYSSSGTQSPLPHNLQFAPDASIVLIGIRGAGKSTLGIIACAAMKRNMVDMEKTFQQATGMSSTEFKRCHGVASCQSRQAQVLTDVLADHATGSVIVCSWLERNVQSLLRDFCATNPVIHVSRDITAIQEHLKIQDESKTASLVNASAAIIRTCSNFHFFNVTEKPAAYSTVGSDQEAGDDSFATKLSAPYLTLKRAERHFLKFLSLIMPPGSIPFIESAFPLATLPIEEREFTYAASIPVSALLTQEVDIEDLETGADAIEIVIDQLRGNPKVNVSPSDALPLKGVGPNPARAGEIARVLGNIRRNTVLPIIFHVILPDGANDSNEDLGLYLDLVAHGFRLAAEFVTVDLRLDNARISRFVATKRRSKIIGNAESALDGAPWASPLWASKFERAKTLGCDLVRLVRPASTMEDNFEVGHLRSALKLLGESFVKAPLIAYNSGMRGRHSACFNPIMTPVAPATMANSNINHASRAQGPCLTALEATQALYSSFIYDPMKLYVFGANVGYSLSPAMHNAALKACGIPHVYEPFSTNSLSNFEALVRDSSFAGASVGHPFKVDILTMTNALSPHAKAIGAANTLIPIRHLNSDGTVPDARVLIRGTNRAGPVRGLFGENTDWIGIRACIRRGLSPANAVRPSSCGLVIGAGGMARAAVYAMLQLGVKSIVIHNRTLQTAQRLVSHFSGLLASEGLPHLRPGLSEQSAQNGGDEEVPVRFHVVQSLEEPWPEAQGFRLPTMIISCIPTHRIGSLPAPDFTVPEAWLGSSTGGVVIELGYKTLDTPLLEQSRREAHRGWVTMDGLDLLPEQGFAQFELFTGRRSPRRLMRRAALAAYPNKEEKHRAVELQNLQFQQSMHGVEHDQYVVSEIVADLREKMSRKLRPRTRVSPYVLRKKRLETYFEGDAEKRFQLEDHHGQGGQASVYKVKYTRLGCSSATPRFLVLKLADPEKKSDVEGLKKEKAILQLPTSTGITHNDVHGDNFMFGPYVDHPEHDISPILKLLDFGQSEVWGNIRHDSGATAEQWNVEDIGLMMASVIILETDKRYTGEEIEIDLSQFGRSNDVLSPASGILPDAGSRDMDPSLDPCPHIDLDLRHIVAACMAEDPKQRPTLTELEEWVYTHVCNDYPVRYGAMPRGMDWETDETIQTIVRAGTFDAEESAEADG